MRFTRFTVLAEPLRETDRSRRLWGDRHIDPKRQPFDPPREVVQASTARGSKNRSGRNHDLSFDSDRAEQNSDATDPDAPEHANDGDDQDPAEPFARDQEVAHTTRELTDALPSPARHGWSIDTDGRPR